MKIMREFHDIEIFDINNDDDITTTTTTTTTTIVLIIGIVLKFSEYGI
jgi:hypothetical protein